MTVFRVLSAELAHETNTFSIRPTAFAQFEAQDCFLSGESALAARLAYSPNPMWTLGTSAAHATARRRARARRRS